MTQADMIKLLFRMGVTDKKESAISRKEIGEKLGQYPLHPSDKRSLANLKKSGEVIAVIGSLEYNALEYYYFDTRLYNVLVKQAGVVYTK